MASATSASRSHESAATGSADTSPATQPAADITVITTRDDLLLELGQTLGGQASVHPVDSLEGALEAMARGKRAQLLVIDARLADDAASVPVGLRGARRAPPDRVDAVAASLPRGAKALVYCAWGFEIGGDCAARLRERGIDAVAIAGGIGAWRADGLPVEPLTEGEHA